jgi:hypothetical protein
VQAQSLEDIFGWNQTFNPRGEFAALAELMQTGDVLCGQGERRSSSLRVASLGRLLFFHSPFPARCKNAVFFGPDSFRFCTLIRANLPAWRSGDAVLDVGAGSGVGGILAASLLEGARLTLSDVNPQALRLAAINAAHAGLTPKLELADGVAEKSQAPRLILANPPYLGSSGRTYSNGGAQLGMAQSIDWTRQALAKLQPGGRMLLYTGAPIIRGRDQLLTRLEPIVDQGLSSMRYEELDPDVFPSTLLHRAYWRVERIAAVGAIIDKS